MRRQALDRIHLAQGADNWWTVVNTVTNCGIHTTLRLCWLSEEISTSQEWLSFLVASLNNIRTVHFAAPIHNCGLTIARSFHNITRHLTYRPTHHINHEWCN